MSLTYSYTSLFNSLGSFHVADASGMASYLFKKWPDFKDEHSLKKKEIPVFSHWLTTAFIQYFICTTLILCDLLIDKKLWDLFSSVILKYNDCQYLNLTGVNLPFIILMAQSKTTVHVFPFLMQGTYWSLALSHQSFWLGHGIFPIQ